MKKSLVALAALAVAGVASAQSSVTLFGVVDAAISGTSNKSDNISFPTLANPFYVDSVKTSRTELRNSGYNSSRLGFRGTEDLGGGLAASFWLEAPISNDNGQEGIATFARRSTVSLSGGFGEIRLGRDYTPTFWNDTVFDPFGTNGVGTNLISTANSGFGAWLGGGTTSVPGFTNVTGSNYVRASNTVGYFLPPNLGGFYGQVMYGFHERTKYDPGAATPDVLNSQRTGRYVGGRFGYANGPLDVAASYGQSTIGDDFFEGLTSSVKTFNVGASYDFGVVKLFGEYSKAKNEIDNEAIFFTPTADIDLKGYLLGVTVPVGPGLIRASYSAVKYDLNVPATLFGTFDDPKANKFAIGYVHNLSKRTALYATVARIRNKNGAGLTVGGPSFVTSFGGSAFQPKTSTGYDFGIRHAF
ncbi:MULTISPECIES: porin [unclassified Variovorax]|uniref:porin n=1 Tax=unclassified Variovorax TaxID=663243 RepID=UPI00076DD8B7|nr:MULTISPECIES: porin [unclassified Variovorax]KWT97364.1 Outer membrane porin protein 32 precursor [Variovorax sp. WDL1]PNG60035.1 Outer membrane porin protein 32 [Variovorax sp. B4]PNG60172.1 Outer membrane porin protein 32 [Variovorax sp. B2]VTV14005.1 Outer membrane porin protein 32 precursor [Variovorax sp. WDL1]